MTESSQRREELHELTQEFERGPDLSETVAGEHVLHWEASVPLQISPQEGLHVPLQSVPFQNVFEGQSPTQSPEEFDLTYPNAHSMQPSRPKGRRDVKSEKKKKGGRGGKGE